MITFMKNFSKFMKSALFVILAVSMVFGVVACDDKDASTGILEEDHVPSVKGKITVTARNELYSSDSAQQGLKNWVAAFESKYPGTDVNIEFVSQENYANLISSKTMGDVYALWDEVVYEHAVSLDALLPLDHYMEKFDVDVSKVYQGIYELGVVDGKTYFLGATCGQQTFIYNVDAVKSANILEDGQDRISNDWTWEDFKEYAEVLTVVDENGQYTQVAASLPVGHEHYYSPFFVGFGGEWVDIVNKRVTLTDDNVLKGIDELLDACEQGWIYPNIEMGSEWTKKFAKLNLEQNAVFQFNSAYSTVITKGQNFDKMGIEWDLATFPLFDEPASPCGTLGFGVFKYSDNLDAAAALACTLYTEDGQKAYHGQSGGDVPIIKSLGEDDFWHLNVEGWEDKNYEAFTANYERYIPGHLTHSVPPEIKDIIHTGMNELFKAFYQGTADVQDSIESIQRNCNNMWKTLS